MGFKWFAPGLFNGDYLLWRRGERRRQLPAPRRQRVDDRQGRTGHELAGCRDHGSTGRDPGENFIRALTQEFGVAHYTRIDERRRRSRSRTLARAVTRGGHGIRRWPANRSLGSLTRAPGNDAPIGGLKVSSPPVAVRGASVRDREHLQDSREGQSVYLEAIIDEAQAHRRCRAQQAASPGAASAS